VTRPWWLWPASASFIAYFLFLNAALYYARPQFGFTYSVEPAGVVINSLLTPSAFGAAGVRPGDRILTIDALPIRDGFDLTIARGSVDAGRPVQAQLERDGQAIAVTVPAMARAWRMPEPVLPFVLVPMAISLILGILIAWRGADTATARLGAWLLASSGCAFLPLWPNGMAEQWRELPLPIGLLLWPAAISSLFVAVLLFVFCARGTNVLSWRATILSALPGVAAVGYVAWYQINVVYDPRAAIDLALPVWYQVAGPASYPAYAVAAAVLLWLKFQRVADVTERRRAKTLLAGVGVGGVGMIMLGIGIGSAQMGRFFPGVEALAYSGALIFCALPLAFAYSILRHRLFDLRVIIRMGLQYALARGAVLALIPIAIGFLILDLIRQGDRPLLQVVVDGAWIYGLFAAVIALVAFNRDRWMTTIDRRFFRERYASQQILHEVVQDVSSAGDLQSAAARVVNRVNSALHPLMVTVMMKPRSSASFAAITAMPATHAVPPLPASSPITQIVRALGRPVAFGSSGLHEVPPHQQRWLTEAGAELVVPIATDPSRDEAMLVLGPRRSEEPYSKEDVELLRAVGASLGLLIGRSTGTGQSETVAVTGPAPLPKISNRYRIERLIGQGGMGMVFAAVDETLDRPVAIKVVKDQQLLGTDGLARFQREARTAASLSHPHIVTIHDYGVDDTGSPYLVMELLDGQSLRTVIEKEGRLAISRTLAILGGVSSAVDAAHAKGVIHRDLKPENVFIVGDTTHAKILDYGIAKAITSTTTPSTTGGVMGTLAYMAPEQASGGTASPAWDHWALSVIAYEMLTGRHPFGGGLPISAAVPIRMLVPDLDEKIATTIDQSLILDPAHRTVPRAKA
jgi:hypothetical protein